MNRTIKRIIADLIIDNQLYREFFDVQDHFDIFSHLARIEKEQGIRITQAENVWFNIYEQQTLLNFSFNTGEWFVAAKGKIKFFKEVPIKGSIDFTIKDDSILNKIEIKAEMQN